MYDQGHDPNQDVFRRVAPRSRGRCHEADIREGRMISKISERQLT